ncbi:DNA ligase (NAD+) [Entomoplasma freundtii]|uniref:DNA ligase n=1 Tax=Entomoplasma freundtii TaxID=74700 RepID=A0A2K8NSU1_9MOLU|nr:NAD-dependent DNA ligase LigA [Entomoplasma freundtii]ATZ16626.1 NAD-dependent DNA ligase [Entomoplasma freundtii]TDY58207.1 DNA ligase (NAD+) [Entomoplasma freundtii]
MVDNLAKIHEEILRLRVTLNDWSHQYYVLDAPTVDDAEYDAKMKELIRLEKAYPEFADANSPSQKVGGSVSEHFQKHIHSSPMLSLGDIFNWEEFLDFNKQVTKITGTSENAYYGELKIDGLSISLTYKNGQLVTATTRGDGLVGEDVTTNVRTIKTIPLQLKEPVDVETRGEIYLPIAEFEHLNEERLIKGETLFANPRNAAAGTLRQLDSKIVAGRHLNSFLYYYIQPPRPKINTQEKAIRYLNNLGFRTNPENRLCRNLDDVKAFIEDFETRRHNLDYQIDGLVFKLNDFQYYEKLGATAKTPRWAIAYKFPAEVKETILRRIFPSVGRTGKITYNADLEPIILSGTKVSAASLNNALWIKAKALKEGCKVKVKKAGEIIPSVVSLVKTPNYDKLPIWQPATHCPICKNKLEQSLGEVDQFCVNFSCPAKILRSMEHFASRGALDIVGLGPSILTRFYEAKLIKTIDDIYRLPEHETEIVNFENFGKKSYDNLVKAVKASKHRSLEKVIFGLGIRHVGAKTAKLLAQKFKTIDALAFATLDELAAVDLIGAISAQSIVDWFAVKTNQKLIQELKNFGVNFTYHGPKIGANTPLRGLSFVITGTLSQPRETIKELLESEGGAVNSSLSKQTSYLIAGTDPGSKIQKAEKLGVTIINEEDIPRLIQERIEETHHE